MFLKFDDSRINCGQCDKKFHSTQIMTESSINTDVVGTPQIHTCATSMAKHIGTRVTWKTTTKGYDTNVD